MNTNIKLGIAALSGALAGSGCTYLVVSKRITAKAEARADEQIESVKQTYKLLRKEPPYDDPAVAVEAYRNRVTDLEYASQEASIAAEAEAIERVEEAVEDLNETSDELVETLQATEDDKAVLRNIFDEARLKYHDVPISLPIVMPDENESHDPDEFDLLKARDPEHPFVISTDLFMDDENEFDKITITYFDEDDTLCDDREQILPNKDDLVGAGNLSKFGNFSDSKDTVYIRNEKLRTDFEVVRENGSYAAIVLGFKEMEDVRRARRKPDDDE